MQKRGLNLWRLFLPVVFVFLCLHFLKDVTQDILGIPTVLDRLGNLQEDVTWLPSWLQKCVLWAGYLSFGIEVALLGLIPKFLLAQNTRLGRLIVVLLLFLLVYFLGIILLDPRYGL